MTKWGYIYAEQNIIEQNLFCTVIDLAKYTDHYSHFAEQRTIKWRFEMTKRGYIYAEQMKLLT